MFDLEFTGERLVPGKVEPELEVEHASRYHLAARYVSGREVLDFGCGAGYGSAILRRAGARRVVGADRAPDAVRYAASRFAGPGVTFCAGDCLRSPFARARFDVVVAFEVIEHVDGYRRFLREARRILRPEGILVLSTPNKKTYRRLGDTPANPFHVHEFHLRGLRRALAAVFPEVVILGQSRTEGAYFYPERTDGGGAAAAADARLDLIGGDGGGAAGPLEAADYFVALCGADRAALAAPPAGGSFHVADDNAVAKRDRRIVELQGELDGRTRWVRQLQDELAQGAGRNAALQSRLDAAERTAREAARERAETERRLEAALGARLDAAREQAAAEVAELHAALAGVAARERERDALVRWHRDTLVRQQGELERHRRDLARRREQDAQLEERLGELSRRSEAADAQLGELSRRADRQDATLAGQVEQMRRLEGIAGRARELIDMLWGSRSWRIYTGLTRGLSRLSAAVRPRRAGRGAAPEAAAEAGDDDRAS
jgi:SAM-dependent methyltransferase